jgi:hypothetical protein
MMLHALVSLVVGLFGMLLLQKIARSDQSNPMYLLRYMGYSIIRYLGYSIIGLSIGAAVSVALVLSGVMHLLPHEFLVWVPPTFGIALGLLCAWLFPASLV